MALLLHHLPGRDLGCGHPQVRDQRQRNQQLRDAQADWCSLGGRQSLLLL